MPYLHIRRYRPEDALELHHLYYSGIHHGCQKEYTPAQLDGWAPQTFDPLAWSQLLAELNPRVVECKGQLVAYADLQGSGMMNHFFVHGDWQGKGVGKALLRHIEDLAFEHRLAEVSCFISLSGQAFFKARGFNLDYSLCSELHGQWLENARMYKRLHQPGLTA